MKFVSNKLSHYKYFANKITGLSSSSKLDAISFNRPSSLPELLDSIKSNGSKDIAKTIFL